MTATATRGRRDVGGAVRRTMGDESAIAVRVENVETRATRALVRRRDVPGERDDDRALTTRVSSSEPARESTRDFVARKREIFLVRMDAENKLREIARLETEASRREEALSKSEAMLEEDQARFDAFLKENDARVRAAVSAAEREARRKHEKMRDTKRLQGEIAAAAQELNRKRDKLRECLEYKAFLDSLTPREWFERHQQTEEDGDAPLPMYFKEPEQLVRVFNALEEQNLFLIQNVRESEQALEEVKAEHADAKLKIEGETQALRDQIKQLTEAIEAEERKSGRLNALLNVGAQGDDKDVESELDELSRRVSKVYVDCGFDYDPSMGVLQMLTNIEVKMEEYLAVIDTLPQDLVANMERQKEQERRRIAREEKMKQQKIEQEQRVQRALERARAPAHKKTGKPLMFRSRLVKPKRRDETSEEQEEDVDKELEDFLARQY